MIRASEIERDFIKGIQELSGSLSMYQVWNNVIETMACSIANTVEQNKEIRDRREKAYERCIKQLGGGKEAVDAVAKLFACVVNAFEQNPEQDFLGAMYMKLDWGSKHTGQCFTPFSVCQCMADLSIDDEAIQKIKDEQWIAVSDPACGAGATLIAAAAKMHKAGINYQTSCIFEGQDVDRTVGMMCYIQLSLIGCPGYVCIASTLSNPVVGTPLMPKEQEGQEFWYTPFYYRDVWNIRRICESFGINTRKPVEVKHEERASKSELCTLFAQNAQNNAENEHHSEENVQKPIENVQKEKTAEKKRKAPRRRKRDPEGQMDLFSMFDI